jgi:hypothetical protein
MSRHHKPNSEADRQRHGRSSIVAIATRLRENRRGEEASQAGSRGICRGAGCRRYFFGGGCQRGPCPTATWGSPDWRGYQEQQWRRSAEGGADASRPFASAAQRVVRVAGPVLRMHGAHHAGAVLVA